MLKVVYTERGEAVSDFGLDEFVDTEIECFLKAKSGEWVVEVSTENALLAFELRALRGEIPLDRVEFYCEDTKLHFTNDMGVLVPDDADEDVSLGIVGYLSGQIVREVYCNPRYA